MLSHKAKRTFYIVAGPLMRANGWIYRYFRAPRHGTLRVHLGPGQKNYIPGWINLDANMFTAKCDVWADFRNGLPFRDATVDSAYSHHVLEHLPDLAFHFEDIFRCLKPGGVYRVGGPNGDAAMKKYLENELNWFSDWPDHRRSIGGRLENFLFCRQEHLTILTPSYLDEMMTEAGFTGTQVCRPSLDTGFPDLFGECLAHEHESDFECPHTLIVEAVKPN
jgi:predicted SAM-dependent methyltransferase